MKQIQINNFLDSDQFLHVARNTRHSGERHGTPLHSHDFPEVFWVESGEGLHVIGETTIPIGRGDLIFVRPNDRHAINFRKGKELCYVNLALRNNHLLELRDRLFPDDPTFWGGRGEEPTMTHLSDSMLAELTASIETLLRAPRSRLMMEWILCELFRIIGPVSRVASGLPDWLEAALRDIRAPEYFSKGSTALAQLAGRTPEHVSRVTRQHLGKTPSQIVNETRIQHAARCLIMSDDEINDIALECGFLSLGQFYNLFKRTYAMTPRHYRLHHQRIN